MFKKIIILIIAFFGLAIFANAASSGTIDSVNRFAKIYAGPYAGTQINFQLNGLSTAQPIGISNNKMQGYAWGEATGWIAFSCEDTLNGCADNSFKVFVDVYGNLTGHAWGQNTGWISFSCQNTTSNCSTPAGNWGVSIVNGNFTGFAWSQNFGWIQFDCSVAGACVSTNWGLNSDVNSITLIPSPITNTLMVPGSNDFIAEYLALEENPELNPIKNPLVKYLQDKVIDKNTNKIYPNPNNTITNSINKNNQYASVNYANNGIISTNIIKKVNNQITKINQPVKADSILNTTVNLSSKIINPNIFNKIENKLRDSLPAAGAFAGILAGLASAFFLEAVSISELFFLPLRLISSAALIFGTVRSKPWGTVFDSITKHPIDPAYVTLVNAVTGEQIESTLTDVNGRYSFDNVKKGLYKIIVSKTKYTFPSNKSINSSPFDNLYQGQEFEILNDGEIPYKNIAIDSTGHTSVNNNSHVANPDNFIWQRLSSFIFVSGFISVMLLTIVNASLLNQMILLLYTIIGLIIYISRIPKLRIKFLFSQGLVLFKDTGLPLSYALVEFIKNDGTVLKLVANKQGYFNAELQEGSYQTKIYRLNEKGDYDKVFESDLIHTKDGFTGCTFEV